MALTYSERFSLCNAGLPGLGCAAASRSMDVSRKSATAMYVALSGRGAPVGGIAPDRSLRMTFSQTGAFEGTLATSDLSSIRPAVLSRSLWQVTQYLSRVARVFDASAKSAGL